MRAYQNVLLDPSQAVICLIDHEPQMFFAVESSQRSGVMNAVTGLAKTAKIFGIPLILTTVEAFTFSGPLFAKVQSVFPDVVPIDRTTLNAWEDKKVKSAIEKTGRKKLLLAGLWTEVCVTLPALSATEDGYDVCVVADASAGSSREAHNMALQRMINAGVTPLTWQAAMLEMQRDWADKATYQQVLDVVTEHGGVYGIGVDYVNTMVPKQ